MANAQIPGDNAKAARQGSFARPGNRASVGETHKEALRTAGATRFMHISPLAALGSRGREAPRGMLLSGTRRMMGFDFDRVFASRPVLLAPMEDVSDGVFRGICRAFGADVCVTEFVRAENLVAECDRERRKIELAPGEGPTAIQIYGSDEQRLAEAASMAEQAQPAFIDLNCGCWVPKVARSGAGAGWLRVPDAMVAMAKMVAARVSLPVTVKTRVGWGDEERMPIVDLARRLEDAGVRALTIHCRTAKMGHEGAADWSWATRAREAVSIPVIVNGDVRSANDAQRALALTGCAGVMIGRRAIEHPWIFREARARLDHRPKPSAPRLEERFALCREHLIAMSEDRGERRAVRAMRRAYPGYLRTLQDLRAVIAELNAISSVAGVLDALDRAEAEAAAEEPGRHEERAFDAG